MQNANLPLGRLLAATLALSMPWVSGQVLAAARSVGQDHQNRMERFRATGVIDDEDVAVPRAVTGGGNGTRPAGRNGVTEAPTGFDSRTNGFSPQGPPYETLNEDNVVALRSFNDNRFIFEKTEDADDGVGPTYNAQSCRECHQNVATGGASQGAEHRTGHMDLDIFFESPGGALIQSRATHPDIVERVAVEDDIRTFRISTNTLGSGYVEAIANSTLLAIRDGQPAAPQPAQAGWG